MTKEQIREILSKSDRWGLNCQPPLDSIVEDLTKLPVQSVEVVADDTIRIRFYRPLTGAEGYLLATLGQDEPWEVRDPIVDVTLWWD